MRRSGFHIIPVTLSLLFAASCSPAKKSVTTTGTRKGKVEVTWSGESTTARPGTETKSPNEVSAEPERKFYVIQSKYASKLGVDPSQLNNLELYQFVDTWYGAPYRYAGKSRSGVDCSGFTSILLDSVFNKNISGPSYSLYSLCEPVEKEKLKEGDLVFFKINKGKISHVGVYLQNNKFVHASTRAGVIINDLDEDYYRKYFFKGGRLKE